MGMRFRRSITLAPGIRMNLSGGGLSWTLGPRGASIGIGQRGTFLNTGLPGTGLYSRQKISPGGSQPRRSPGTTTTTFTATISIGDDGTLTFKDEAGYPLPEARIDALKKQQGDALHKLIQGKCDEINNQIEALGDIYHYTSNPKTHPQYVPNAYDLPMPFAPEPKKAGFLGWLFSSIAARIEAENAAASQVFERKVADWQHAKSAFESSEAARKKIFSDVLTGEAEAMEQFFSHVLSDIVWPRETLVSLEVEDDSKRIWINVDLPEIDDMPRKTASVPQRGYKLSVKEMGATWVQKLYMKHIHAIGFRIIGEAFAMLPSVDEVVLSGYSQRPSAATGQVGDEYLYSVQVNRWDWEAINFDNLAAVDVVEAFSRFDLRRSMTKTGIFKPIDPFTSAR